MAKIRKQRTPADGIAEDEIQRETAEVAQFLVRIFGSEAREIAADRAKRSDQPEEWRRVLTAVEALLDADAASFGRRRAVPH
jgi:hypothetical protein